MVFIMKNRECVNCGSKNFHSVKNGWKCDYCSTLYVNEKKWNKAKETPVQLPTKKKRQKILIGLTLSAVFLLILPLVYLSYTLKLDDNDVTIYEPNDSDTDSVVTIFPGEWTEEIYTEILVATEYYDASKETYSYEFGSNYEELEKLVGSPEKVTSWEDSDSGMPDKSSATWSTDKNGEYSGGTIVITYEKKTNQIIDKEHY